MILLSCQWVFFIFSLEFDEQIKKQRVKPAFFTLYLILILILIDINWINLGFLYFFFNLFVRLHSFVYMSIIYLVPIQHKFLVLGFHFNKLKNLIKMKIEIIISIYIYNVFIFLHCILYFNIYIYIDNSVSNKYNPIMDNWIYLSSSHRFDFISFK